MNYMKIFCLLLLAASTFAAQAQTRQEQSTTARAENSTQVQAQQIESSTPARASKKSYPAPGASGRITTPKGSVLTLCCGSVNINAMTGDNCAYMAAGQACAGAILACPNGTKDTVDENSEGYCKKTGG